MRLPSRRKFISAAAAIGGSPAFAQSLRTRTVSSVGALYDAIASANKSGGQIVISLDPGDYFLDKTIDIAARGIRLTSTSRSRSSVRLVGDSMSEEARLKNMIRVAASDFAVSHVTMRLAGWHLIQIAGEYGAHSPTIEHCTLADSWQQLIKVTAKEGGSSSANGLISNCEFLFTNGVTPHWYCGGIDAHGVRNWVIRKNTFQGIASPGDRITQHAVHLWSGSRDNLVEQNMIVDCDRGVGFGLKGRPNAGGAIRNNFFHHRRNAHRFGDAAIILEDSQDAQVYHNTVLSEHDYPNAIELRTGGTARTVVANNLTNRAIRSFGASGTGLSENRLDARTSMFRRSVAGDLRLHPSTNMDELRVKSFAALDSDYDGSHRMRLSAPTVGAFQLGER